MEKEICLYRLKLLKSSQLQLPLNGEISRTNILYKSLQEKYNHPSDVSKDWKIGNLVCWDNVRGYFSLGRQGSLRHGQFDEENKTYGKQSIIDCPYTTVLFNLDLQLIAIVKNSKLGHVDAIVKNFQKILKSATLIKELDLTVSINPIPDPSSLLQQIQGAYQVPEFKIYFTKPNPADIADLFHRDSELLAEASQADIGITILKGEDLSRETLSNLTKSFAATGNQVEAKIKYSKGDKLVTKTLGEQPYIFLQEEDLIASQETLGMAENIYEQIRCNNENN